MAITVKLYGTLGRHIKGYTHSKGLTLTHTPGLTPGNILSKLNIPHARVGLATVNNNRTTANQTLPDHCIL
ncbi:MAG: hypothetical protein MI749_09875, partial [Desulfovibrionales bacterium]|nr:hypothetical protein [Desulfovibrionales bacterium]